ncbi:MAG: CNNM domain-containing protein [Planctomycetota bacterium]|jgi:CBS domain containing-hemolysin-like protein
MSLLLLYASLAIGISFLCSLLEASLLSLPMSHVELMRQQGSWVGTKLAEMKESIDKPLAGILTLNTVANTAGATGVGVQAGIVFGSESLGIVGAIMTVLILIVSEIIPKTLGAVHCRRLAPFTAITVKTIVILTYPALIIVAGLNRFLKPKGGANTPSRNELRANLLLGRRKGALEDHEFRVLDNYFALSSIKVKDIMTPRTVVFRLPVDQSVREANDQLESLPFTRIPIHPNDDLDHTEGYVTRGDILQASRDGRLDRTLADIATPLQLIPEVASVANALDLCLREQEHILMVIDEYGGVAGLITLEDVMETLLGVEIVDEDDTVVDMQALAREQGGIPERNP